MTRSEIGTASTPIPFYLRYGITRTGDPALPLVIEPYPQVCRAGALRLTVVAAAVDIVGSLFAREAVGRDGIFTVDLSVRAPLRPPPKRIVARGELLRAGRNQIASEALLEVDAAPFACGQTIFQRVPREEPSGSNAGDAPVGLPEVLENVPLERPLAQEAGVVVVNAARGQLALPLGPALVSPQGFLQGGLVALVVEEAALALAEHSGAGPQVVTDLDIRYLASGRVGPIESEACWVTDRSGAAIRVALRDAGNGGRITTAALARVTLAEN
jgi:acyl-coenzyme A thioesterase PaaI-like protein